MINVREAHETLICDKVSLVHFEERREFIFFGGHEDEKLVLFYM